MPYDNDDTPYKMPQFSGRNILVFSDGTGQAGGILFDEARSNVYKLYRATRSGPDSTIDPDAQLAIYDPGLGSARGAERIRFALWRKIYNVLSSATGLGITQNIIDCYAALIQLWRPGDRIFLFGFSRGAYTVRCLGGVIGLCGIPTAMPDNQPLLRDHESARKIASEAVKRVYRHGSGAGVEKSNDAKKVAKQTERRDRLGYQRQLLADQFREKYASDVDGEVNTVPHFIGVWDTVAAVGVSPPAWRVILGIVLASTLLLSGAIAWAVAKSFAIGFWLPFLIALACLGIGAVIAYLITTFKIVTDLPNVSAMQTAHLTPIKMAFFDNKLNRKVRYARHAIAIDERRADFDRVPWVNEGEAPNRDIEEGSWFKQVWFAGNHSDVGGSYPENESRLSDIALKWMATEAKKAGLLVNENYLRVFGRSDGPQHDEVRAGIKLLGMRFNWKEGRRRMVANAPFHPSVADRFNGQPVLNYDVMEKYRPTLLSEHEQFAEIYQAEKVASA